MWATLRLLSGLLWSLIVNGWRNAACLLQCLSILCEFHLSWLLAVVMPHQGESLPDGLTDILPCIATAPYCVTLCASIPSHIPLRKHCFTHRKTERELNWLAISPL